MGDAPYGKHGKTYGGAARVRTLLTLGTPHYSLEKYPFGRIPENLAANVVDSDGSDPLTVRIPTTMIACGPRREPREAPSR
jgi:hypothetical protein